MRILIGDDITIYADGYIPIPEEQAIQFYREKSVLDDIPPIKIADNMLSDFGKKVFDGTVTQKRNGEKDE